MFPEMAKNIYFISDTHLGASVPKDNGERERQLVAWLDYIRPDCSELFLLGDIFDFWFEYKRVVPKGFMRFLGKICEYTDSGVTVHFFTGNHDIWAFDYLQKECGMTIHTRNEKFHFCSKEFYIGHGDGLDPKDKGYLFIKKIFHNPFLQYCFRWIHPDAGIAFAHKWSAHSRLKRNNDVFTEKYRGSDDEEIESYCRKMLLNEFFDYFIFGHRHLPLDIPLSGNSRYINTGDWITHYSYAVFNGEKMALKTWPYQS